MTQQGHQQHGEDTQAGRAASGTENGTHGLGDFPLSQSKNVPGGTGTRIPCCPQRCWRLALGTVSSQWAHPDRPKAATERGWCPVPTMAFPSHVHGKLFTVPKPRHLLLNPTLSHVHCHPCHPAAGAGKAQGWTRLPSPSLSPHLLPLTPATRRETQGQQSTLESSQLCQQLCVGEEKAEPFPARPWKVCAGHTCAAPWLLHPVLCSWQCQCQQP